MVALGPLFVMQEGPFGGRNSVWWLVRSCVSGVVNELKSTVSKEGGFLPS